MDDRIQVDKHPLHVALKPNKQTPKTKVAIPASMKKMFAEEAKEQGVGLSEYVYILAMRGWYATEDPNDAPHEGD